MQGFQTHTATQPISIQLLQTQQKPCVTEARHNAEKHSLLLTGNTLFWSHVEHVQNLQNVHAKKITNPNLTKYIVGFHGGSEPHAHRKSQIR